MGWGFRLLAPMKVLRGTALDVFGYTEERREERALIGEYRSAIEGMLPALSASNRDDALAFARVPEHIRGYGHVKARHLKAARTQWVDLLARYHASPATQQARAA
jgi:indolepyruvate ferredoxin oxidoreductase